MYRAFSFPMTAERSRNKERLEASLAGLCELELLKQRQECLVLSALSLGDSVPGRPAWGDVQAAWPVPETTNCASDDFSYRRHTSSLQCTPCGLMASLEQQVGELRMDTEDNAVEASTELMDIRPSSGEFFVANREGQPESGSRPTVPLSFSAPYPSLEGIAEGAGEGEDKAWAWDHSSGPGGGLDVEGEPTEEDYRQAQRVETYILSLIQRRALSPRPCKPRTAITVARQSSLCRKDPLPPPPAASIPEHHPHHHQAAGPPPSEGPPASWACHSLDQEPYACIADSPHPYHHGYPAPPPPRSPPSPDEQLVNAQYIPAQPLRAPTARASAHSHSHRGAPGGPKPSRGAYSPVRGSQQQPAPQQLQQAKSKAAPKKCRFSEERERERERDRERERERPVGSKKPGRRACRSQSENSLNGQRGVPERKYSTVERDGGGSGSGSGRGSQSKGKRPQPGSTGYRRWRSTLELSQDEAEQPPQPPPADQGSRRTRKPRPPPPPYAYINPHPHHHPHLEYLDRELATLCQPEERYPHPGQGESESSLSEDSPASSSLSSDSDESGGLVWPQQLPPQLSSPLTATAPAGAPLQPKAFVKIKASHALKKKILRFRTGSLKVMTTV
ncbi:dapper homolog 1-like isoform X1 [Oncorhynchus keta]|uniref:dapper homolog 1-like isoform X1 n=2 Tax=Oncorhynchus keta TaxID=8018 RepID=UPI0015FB47A0|nr:dapper homolog 1-like isoform X1 [Oncorhynchus keta]